MKKSKTAFYEGCKNGLRLLWSPFAGAWAETQAATNSPAKSPKEFFMRALRSYFAPLIGAVRGFSRTFRDIWHQH